MHSTYRKSHFIASEDRLLLVSYESTETLIVSANKRAEAIGPLVPHHVAQPPRTTNAVMTRVQGFVNIVTVVSFLPEKDR